jgi:hypothetical protein
MGEAPDEALVPIQFHNEMWQKLNAVINEWILIHSNLNFSCSLWLVNN